MDIQYFHNYNRLVRRGLVKPLTCSAGHEVTLRATLDAEPVLECYTCGSRTQPGLAMYQRVQAVVKEHFA